MTIDPKWLLAFELLKKNKPLLEEAGSSLNTTGHEMANLSPALMTIIALGHGASAEDLAAAEGAILPQAYEFRRILQERVSPALSAVVSATAEVIPFLDAIIGEWVPPVPKEEPEPEEGTPEEPQPDLFDEPLLLKDGPLSVAITANDLDQ